MNKGGEYEECSSQVKKGFVSFKSFHLLYNHSRGGGHGCRPQILIPEIEYYQKMFSHAQIGSQGAEKQQSSVNVGGWWVVGGWYEAIAVTVRLRLNCNQVFLGVV